MPVKKSVFKGGLGEIEAVVFASTLNLNDGNIKGGQMWRITPMINWYLAQSHSDGIYLWLWCSGQV